MFPKLAAGWKSLYELFIHIFTKIVDLFCLDASEKAMPSINIILILCNGGGKSIKFVFFHHLVPDFWMEANLFTNLLLRDKFKVILFYTLSSNSIQLWLFLTIFDFLQRWNSHQLHQTHFLGKQHHATYFTKATTLKNTWRHKYIHFILKLWMKRCLTKV